MYLYLLSGENLELSKAEVLALAKNKAHEADENILLLDELVDFKRLAYTKKAYQLFFSCSAGKLADYMKGFDFNAHYKGSFKLNLVNNESFDVGALADIIWDNLDKPKASMKKPKTIFEVVFAERAYCCLLLWENKEPFEERKAHLRPFNHPTSLNPRLARCMINLASSDEILDPFCGSGGILIEAALSGIKAEGFDIDASMLEKAKKNLEYFKVKNFRLTRKDALTISKQVRAVVTDVPYGRNSKVSAIEKTYMDFLKNYYYFAERMVVAFPDFAKAESLIKKTKWSVEHKFTCYLHRSLSKDIFVLFKK